MNKRSILLAVIIAACALVSLLFWRSHQSINTQKTLTKTTLKVGYLPSLAAAPIFVAKQQGFFAQENIEIDLAQIFSGPDVIQGLQSKSINIGFGVLPTTIMARAKGAKVRSLVGVSSDSAKAMEHRLIVKADGPIKTPMDLKGKKIALVAEPTSDGLSLFEFLKAAGISRSDVQIVKMPHPEMIIAVAGGSVDAAAALEPFITEGSKSGKIKELAFYYPSKRTEVATFLVDEDWLANNRDAADGFARAIRNAIQWMNDDLERLRKTLPDLKSVGFPVQISAETAGKIHLPEWDMAPTSEGVNNLAELLREYGFLQGQVRAEDVLPSK